MKVAPSILFLGDSYTIGEDVSPSDAYPLQLISRLSAWSITNIDYRIIAKTGWTIDELLAAIEGEQLAAASYDLVFLLIGVNNQYRGYPMSQYENEFRQCLNIAMQKAKTPDNVIVVSIPDYGVTPFGKAKQNQIRNQLDIYNLCASHICKALQVPFVNISEISHAAEFDLSLLAGDKLHPSGKMYSLWVEHILHLQKEHIINALTQ